MERARAPRVADRGQAFLAILFQAPAQQFMNTRRRGMLEVEQALGLHMRAEGPLHTLDGLHLGPVGPAEYSLKQQMGR